MTNWIFLRGLTRDSRHWGRFLQTFRERVPDADVHALDLPGNGLLNRLRSPATVTQMTDFCRTELIRQRASPPYHVLAMSLGAMVALDWAATHPNELRGCVLINTSVRTYSPFHQRLKPGSYAPLLGLALFGGTDRQWESAILRLTSTRPDAGAAVVDQWTDYRRERPVSRANALRQLLAAARFRSPIAAPGPRLLLLASGRDALVSAGCSRSLAAAWSTAFAEHPGAGHDLPLDDGAWVAEQVAAWLGRPGDSGVACCASTSSQISV